MRIALFTEVFFPKIDGITNRLAHTIRCLVDQGHEVRVFAPETAVDELNGASVFRVPGVAFPPYPDLRVTAPDPRILWELWRFRPDVVHAVGPACLGIWGIAAGHALGVPVVASYHTDLARYAPLHGLGWCRGAVWPLLRQVHGAATLNLAPSRHSKGELEAQGLEDVGLWRGGVDTELFHPSRRCTEMRLRLSGGRPEGPVLLYVGRVSPEKHIDLLGHALDAIPGARAAVVGDGPARLDLERTFADRPMQFLGFLRGEELATAFASADVFVMPSTTETLGFVVLEAMSAGLPVVAARAGGIPDLVQHEENGLLYDPERPQDAFAAIGELLSNPGMRRFCASQGRKAAERGSWASETRKLVDHYRRSMAMHQPYGALGRLGRLGQALLA
jgi:glycosyltransferase involved in cell wall biosynthesis